VPPLQLKPERDAGSPRRTRHYWAVLQCWAVYPASMRKGSALRRRSRLLSLHEHARALPVPCTSTGGARTHARLSRHHDHHQSSDIRHEDL